MYDAIVLADSPVLFHNGTDGTDATGNGRSGTLFNSPTSGTMPNGDLVPVFNGSTQYIEVADHDSLSVPTTGILTLEAWIRPDTLEFPNQESTGYVHWMGKGDVGQAEYVARMYSLTTTDNPPRPNRISGYAYNLAGGLGTGGYWQDPVTAGEWIHYVFTINTVNTSVTYPTGYGRIWKNGVERRRDSLSAFSVVPGNGTDPFRIGTRDFGSWFQGAIGKVAVYDRELSTGEIANHHQAMTEASVADNLTNTAENLMLDWVNGVGTPTRPTTPLKLALVTANGTDSAAGTEVTGGSYARQNVTLSAAATGATSNSGAVTYTDMPAATVVGVEVWDSAVTPVRLWYGPLAANKTLNAGDTFTIAAGDLDLTLG